MKIRTGFVSNSSSSSYVCDVCHRDYTGYDASLRDAQMYSCKNGHTFCESHLKDKIDRNAFREVAIEQLTRYRKNFADMDEDDREEAIEECIDELTDDRYDIPESACPSCTFQSSTDGEILEFLFKKYGLTRVNVQNMMRERFKTFKEFKDFIA